MSPELQQIADLIRSESGVDVRRMGIRSLEAAIDRVAPGATASDLLRALRAPHEGASLRTLLIEALVVHETFFFRQPRDLQEIDWHAMFALARESGVDHVRVWVAACATGEEAYTIGILASEAFGSPTPPVSILATDISAAVLLRAEHAHYRDRAVHAVEPRLVSRYFDHDGDTFHIKDSVRALVQFRRHNLIHDPAPAAAGPFQLILCRNALIYFAPPTVEQVLLLLEDALVDGGTLILSAADRLSGAGRGQGPRPGDPDGGGRQQLAHPRRRDTHPPARNDWRSRVTAELAAPALRNAPDTVAEQLSAALACADAGRLTEAVAATAAVIAGDPLNADAHFIRGIVQLRLGDAVAATESLRSALYVEPGFALAAFKLGTAFDAVGDEPAARRAYTQTLRTLGADDERHARLAGDIDVADVAAACRARLAASAHR